jgi:hypothetical protein
VSIDIATLPENYVLVSSPEIAVDLTADREPRPMFQIKKQVQELPVRKVFDGRQ